MAEGAVACRPCLDSSQSSTVFRPAPHVGGCSGSRLCCCGVPCQQSCVTSLRVDRQNEVCHVVGNGWFTSYHLRPGGTRQDVLAVLWFCHKIICLIWSTNAVMAYWWTWIQLRSKPARWATRSAKLGGSSRLRTRRRTASSMWSGAAGGRLRSCPCHRTGCL